MLLVWLAVTLSASTGTTYAPVVFATQADCQAFAKQIPNTRCYSAQVKP